MCVQQFIPLFYVSFYARDEVKHALIDYTKVTSMFIQRQAS